MVFLQIIPYDKFNKGDNSFEDNTSQYDHLSSHITVSSILYCDQHIIVSNKILCPHLLKGSFVHLSNVKVLWSYHATLSNHLSLDPQIAFNLCFRWHGRTELSPLHPELVKDWIDLGAKWIGGCCQIFPPDIAALVKVVKTYVKEKD